MANYINSINTNNTPLDILSNGGVINIGTQAATTTVTIGNNTNDTAVIINSGFSGSYGIQLNSNLSGTRILTGGGTLDMDANGGTVFLNTNNANINIGIGGSGSINLGPGSSGLVVTTFSTTGALVSNASGLITDANANTAGYVLTSNGSGSVPSFQFPQTGPVWNNVTTTSATMAAGNGYSSNNASLVTLTLPATIPFGSIIQVSGYGAGGWTITQNSGQTIHFGSISTTTGTGGSLSSTSQYDQVTLLCAVANTDFVVNSSLGMISYV